MQTRPLIAISRYLDERLVLFTESETRDAVLQQMVDLLDQQHRLKDKKAFYRAILEREKIVSTGIGLGVAVPHAKLEGYDDFFIAVGVQKQRGIEWNALDGAVVRLVFMIGGPESRQTEYLKILSQLTIVIKNGELRKKLLEARTAREIINLFHGY